MPEPERPPVPSVAFFVPGTPAPGGSKRAFVAPATGRVVVQDDCRRNRPWRDSVASVALAAMGDRPPFSGPLLLDVRFVLPRPKGHYRTGRRAGQLRPNAPLYHTSKPDATKLLRSTEDALKGLCWRDDSQVAVQAVVKQYGDRPGAHVRVRPIPEAGVVGGEGRESA